LSNGALLSSAAGQELSMCFAGILSKPKARKQGDKRTRNSESEVNSDRSVSLGRQGRLDYVNFGTYVPRI
jgi:hypothetical protein